MLQIDVTKLVGHDGLRNKFLLSINEKFPEILDCFGIPKFWIVLALISSYHTRH
jgi:hypothetical protein